ncbi:MAG: hypothetical protein ACAH80_09795 [Alphaproteobacteria bacterium]
MLKKLTLMCMGLMLAATPALANDRMTITEKVEMFMGKMDTNNDGTVSKAECEAFGVAMFNETDLNSDGKLSKDEMILHKVKEMDAMKEMKDKD